MNKKLLISLAVGTAVSVATLYLAFRNVPLVALLDYLAAIDYFWIAPSILAVLLAFCLRAIRWQFILASTSRVEFRQAFHPLMIGFMINCVLPGRVGELARPLILNRRRRVPLSTGLATVFIERLFDMVVLLTMFIAVSAFVEIDPEFGIAFGGYRLDRSTLELVFTGMLKISAVLIVGILLVSIGKTRSLLNRVLIKLPEKLFFLPEHIRRRMARRLCTPLIGMIDNAAGGMALIKSPRRSSICLLYSLAIWLLTAGSYYVFSLGCPQIRLSFFEMTAVMVIICFAIALPSVPGYWGIWEAGGVFAMLLFGTAAKDAAGFTLANHAVQVLPVIAVGMVSAWLSGVNILRVSYQNRRRDANPPAVPEEDGT
jgi:uncharacterized protein (TIRG00374 family)